MLLSTPHIRSVASVQTKFCAWSAVIGALVFAILFAGRAAAAEASDNNTEAVLEEITVTASKRGLQTLQDVPMTITALSGDTIEAMGADNFTDFARVVPGLTFQDQGPGDKFYIIRGLQSKGKATTGVYYDETVVTSSTQTDGDGGGRQPDIKLVDIERIEVLRGPQGTLYGSSSMGGTLRFITRKPNAEEFSANIDITGSSTSSGGDNWAVNGMLNFPLVEDKLALRVVGWTRNESGFVDNIRLGNSDINTERTDGGRATARWYASEDLTLTASATYQDMELGGRQRYYPDDGDLQQTSNTVEPWEEELQIYNLTAEYDFGSADLLATVSLFERDLSLAFDTTPILEFLGVPEKARTTEPQDYEIWTSEIRVTSKFEGRFQGVLGLYFMRSEQGFFSTVPEVAANGLPLNPKNDLFSRTTNNQLDEDAIFGELYFDITEKLTAIFGARWFDISQTDTSALIVPFFLFGGTPGPGPTLTADESDVTLKFGLSYRATDDALIYAQAAEGYRPGGTNDTGITGVVSQFQSDSLWNYEIGTKTSWLGNRLTVNGALYTIRWDDMQVSDVDPTGGFTFINNAGKAQIDGIELELATFLTRGLSLSLTGGYQDARLTEDQPAGGGGDDDDEEGGAPGKDGDSIPHVPEFTGSASLQYEAPIRNTGLNVMVRTDISYTGSSNTKFRPDDPFFHKKSSYTLANLRGGIEADNWSVILFVNNLFDERADVNVVEGFADTFQIFTNRPRTVGLTFRMSF